MKVNFAGLLLGVGLIFLAIGIFGKTRVLPVKRADEVTYSQPPTENFKKDADIGAGTIGAIADNSSDDQLATLLENPNLPSAVKSELIDVALSRQDSRLLHAAEKLVRAMVQSGSLADALAAIPKAAYFSPELLQEIAAMQTSLCRFQSPLEEFGFEMIKMKFAIVLGREPGVKPWPSVCGAT